LVNGTHDFRGALKDIQCTSVLLQGAKSRICNEAAMEFMLQNIPNSKAVIFERSAHDFMLNEPIKFARVFSEFLATGA
jgi:pimeloyl-ACP methyl ester carboxylesterase